jgi:hypothetical protein
MMKPSSAEPSADTASFEERLTSEALRVYRRYQMEIVEALGLCPWAVRARLDHKVVSRVILQRDASLDPSLAAISDVAKNAKAEVVILIYPRFAKARSEFEQFVARLRDADAKRHPLGEIPFVLAAFHPIASPDTADPERLVPFLRRSPDPSIQLLSSAVIERIRDTAPQGTQFVDAATQLDALLGPAPVSLRDRIAKANLTTVQKLGLDVFEARIRDILRDRDESYRALGA